MRITVKLFATYREIIGTSVLELDIPQGSNTRSLLTILKQKNKKLSTDYAIVAVNSEYVSENAVIKDGDEVAIIPPVSGG
ncbi:MAG: molybdopterin converting factor subunit 1 [Dehalococcoidia bacterium]|nr:molybdopterin converting factor subunit 1 [Dehalococcoidia bacterium]